VSGPLAGVRVLEIGSIGPGPFCAMVLADMGAAVVRLERPEMAAPGSDPPPDPLLRGRKGSICVDLKSERGPEVALRLVDRSDVLIEGFRPGVMERLGLGPSVCLERNPRLVYGRMTGWGRAGPRAGTAGHDIDYLAVSGVLHPLGDADRPPTPPLNLVADFGGGGMVLALGIAAALFERSGSGQGQVVDAAMVEGSSLLAAMFHGFHHTGAWTDSRASNLLDGGAPFYACYETSDSRFVAVGALEPAFYAALIEGLGLEAEELPGQYDSAEWPKLRRRFEEVFRTRTRDEWAEVFAGTDSCVAPVNALGEAPLDPTMQPSFVEVDGIVQPGPTPAFSRTGASVPGPPRPPGGDTEAVLVDAGFTGDDVRELRELGVVA
jgi:alpha-methylacyl-CoA racemase